MKLKEKKKTELIHYLEGRYILNQQINLKRQKAKIPIRSMFTNSRLRTCKQNSSFQKKPLMSYCKQLGEIDIITITKLNLSSIAEIDNNSTTSTIENTNEKKNIPQKHQVYC